MRKLLTTLITLALLAVALPAFASGDHKIDICHKPGTAEAGVIEIDKHAWDAHEEHGDYIIESRQDKKDCKPPVEETTTTLPLVEVCRDDELITIPADEVLETDDRVFNDFQRDNCEPRPPTPPNPTPPGPVIEFPPYSVGYICPGTDGVVYELPWGTYEDMWPTPESAKLYGCPEEIPVVLIPPISTPTTERLVELPFTGIDPGLGVLAGLALLGLGGLLVRRSDA